MRWDVPSRRARRLEKVASIDDLRRLAQKRLPRVCFDFVDGGADSEVTMRLNRTSFDRITFRPRTLVDVADRQQSTVVCGTKLDVPVILAPTGSTRVVSRHAEIEAARAAGLTGTAYCLSTMASSTIEDVARAATGPLWFQLFLWRRDDVTRDLLRRARECGYTTLVVTVDTPISSKRNRDWRNGFTIPLRLGLIDRLEALRHPAWVWDYVRGPEITFANLQETLQGSQRFSVLAKMVNEELANPGATYEDLARIRNLWHGPLLVKGTLTAEDGERAVACGVDGLIVSNHGGRQLDCASASIDALPEIARAVGSKIDVLLDSGVRNGSDVVKAAALGAKAVMIGRPYLWGLAAAGQSGVELALRLLSKEIDTCLALIGRASFAELDNSAVRWADYRIPEAVS